MPPAAVNCVRHVRHLESECGKAGDYSGRARSAPRVVEAPKRQTRRAFRRRSTHAFQPLGALRQPEIPGLPADAPFNRLAPEGPRRQHLRFR
jgi:hypothetical protein